MIEPTEFMGYKIVAQGGFPHFLVKQKISGEVPDSLKGMFTTVDAAKKAILAGYDRMSPKGRKMNAESKGRGK